MVTSTRLSEDVASFEEGGLRPFQREASLYATPRLCEALVSSPCHTRTPGPVLRTAVRQNDMLLLLPIHMLLSSPSVPADVTA